jgi:hypothetical protein
MVVRATLPDPELMWLKRTPEFGYELQFYTTIIALPLGFTLTAIGAGIMLEQLDAIRYTDRTTFEAGMLVFVVGLVGMIAGTYTLYAYVAKPDPPARRRPRRISFQGMGIAPTQQGTGAIGGLVFSF